MLTILPFRICIKTIKKSNFRKHTTQDQLQEIKTAIDQTDCLTFWKNVCLVKSFAARWMLQRRKIDSLLSIGVAHDTQKKLKAHAWLKAGDFEIVNEGGNYTNIIYL